MKTINDLITSLEWLSEALLDEFQNLQDRVDNLEQAVDSAVEWVTSVEVAEEPGWQGSRETVLQILRGAKHDKKKS